MKKRIFSNENEDVSDFGNDFRKSFTYILLKYHSNNPRVFTFEDVLHEARTIMVGVSKLFFVHDNFVLLINKKAPIKCIKYIKCICRSKKLF